MKKNLPKAQTMHLRLGLCRHPPCLPLSSLSPAVIVWWWWKEADQEADEGRPDV